MSKVKSRTTTEVTVRGRVFEVEKIRWKDSHGLSFDVSDKETGQALHDESFDDEPDEDSIGDLLDDLVNDLAENQLDPYLEDDKATLVKVLGLPDEVATMQEPHKCDRCSTWYDETSGDGYCGLCPSCADKGEEPVA